MKLSLVAYHYISRIDEFERIWGHSFELFKRHLDYYCRNFKIISADELVEYREKRKTSTNLLIISFDDGLVEHYVQIKGLLEKNNIKGLFSIPTCILRNEPANPQIIHFGMAYYGIRQFYDFIIKVTKKVDKNILSIFPANPENLDLFVLYRKIKEIFRKYIDTNKSRYILLNIYNEYIKKDFPNFMEIVYMTPEQIKDLKASGHVISLHTDTHPAVSGLFSESNMVENEIIKPRVELESHLGAEVEYFTYPFGQPGDIMGNTSVLKSWKFRYFFTTFFEKNVFNPFMVGRYCSQSGDTIKDLKNNIWSYNL
jgi:peptidoglycan/xylan/chitin deacetylase (PgdA/CDA1 family)